MKQAVLNAAMKKGASMVQVLAAQSGLGLKKMAQDLDRGIRGGGGGGGEEGGGPMVMVVEKAKAGPTAKERQIEVRRE